MQAMTSREFLNLLEQQLEVSAGTLQPEQQLADIESWDSLTAIEFIALADDTCGAQINGTQLVACQTVGDLLTLVPLSDSRAA